MEDEDFTVDPQDESSQGSKPSLPQSYRIGFVIANIVRTEDFPGTITDGEVVGLVREPLNPDDKNAIKVFNSRADQVGYIDRSVATVLSQLIDFNLISTECIVPNSRAADDNRIGLPCQIYIFAAIGESPTVKGAISRGGVDIISNTEASIALSEATAVKEKKATKKPKKSVDEIFKLVDVNVSKKSAFKLLKPPRTVIKTKLFVHQNEGLWWLFDRENSGELPPFWEEKDGVYVNVLTNSQTHTRPEPWRGGIFADDMGLGKTLTLLSLIALDKDPSSYTSSMDISSVNIGKHDELREQDERLSVSGGRMGKRERPSKNSTRSLKRRMDDAISSGNHVQDSGGSVGIGVSSTSMETKTTLVVCPSSVYPTWITQLEEHTEPDSLKKYEYYGNDRTKDAEELKKYDIVLTTYGTLGSYRERYDVNSPLMKVEWWRIILDGAHKIKNTNTQESQAVTHLIAKRRWAVTGTPIQNGSPDLFSLMAFLRFEPFSCERDWQGLVQRDDRGHSRLQVLMATISLRRTKDKILVELPTRTLETYYVDLSGEEREMYDPMERHAKSTVQTYINEGSQVKKYYTVLTVILRLRQICTDLRLCSSSLKSVPRSNNIKDVSNKPELLQKLLELLQDGEDFECPICYSHPTDIVITCCAHIFCRACILNALQSKSSCPYCRHILSESDLFSAPQSSEADGTGASSCRTWHSSKVSALIKLLTESRDEDPTTKSVVFSHFSVMLSLLEEPLKAAGFKYLRLDANMDAQQKACEIQKFGVTDTDRAAVLVASLKVSDAVINLTAAARVYLFEPWWNYSGLEEQAMDCFHRIGQKRDVKIVRLIARNSIEERILELQEKKQLAKKGAKSQKKFCGDDLRFLVSI